MTTRINRKKIRIHDHIVALEDHLRMSLRTKDSSKSEVNVAAITKQIEDLRNQLRG